MKVTVIPVIISALGTASKGLVRGLEELKNRGTIKDHSNYSIIKIGQDTEKSPGDLSRLAVMQTCSYADWREKLTWNNNYYNN